MAHFAELDNDVLVLRVIVVSNADTSTPDGTEVESIGVAFCQRLFGGNWKQTSYNNKFRVRYAGIGYAYLPSLDAFVPPKPYPSWTLDNATAEWVSPVPMPTDGKRYVWNEETQSWDVVNEN